MICCAMSRLITPGPGLPWRITLMVSGTLSQISPIASACTAS